MTSVNTKVDGVASAQRERGHDSDVYLSTLKAKIMYGGTSYTFSNMSSTSTQQYLLYASLLLGSIGTYHALKDGVSPTLDSEVSISDVLSRGDISSADLTTMFTQLSRKVDENAAAKAANSTTIGTVAGDTTALRADVDTLSLSIGAVDAFLASFNSKSTDVHNMLADVEATLTSLTAFNNSSSIFPVEIDSAYVTNLSKRIGLMETSATSSKQAAFTARDGAEINKASLARLKTSVDMLTTEFSSAKIASGQVAQLTAQVQASTPASSSITAMTSRLNGLTTESQDIATRLSGLETWKAGKVNESRSVTLDSSASQISQSVLDRMTDEENIADTNDVNIATLRSDVNLNTDDIAVFSVDLQQQISLNKAATNAVSLKADTTDDAITNILTPRVTVVETDIASLEAEDVHIKSRILALEEAEPLAAAARGVISADVAGVASRITANETAVTDLEDDVELQ